jgi:hypothetical protein
MIIGIVGNIGSGKDTAAEYMVSQHQYDRDSFAKPLKDAIAAVFQWDRELLEGQTKASREWREQIDEWWAERLNIPHLTPRWVLQYWGTEVCRYGFHGDIWIASLEKRLLVSQTDVVISDCRFENEINVIKKLGGKIIHVRRGAPSHWEEHEIAAAKGDPSAIAMLNDAGIHTSEWAWRAVRPDFTVDNNETLEVLYSKIDEIINL